MSLRVEVCHKWVSLFVWLILLIGVSVAIFTHSPPAIIPGDAPLTEFSAERAFSQIESFSKVPHAAGTPENAKVRDYIVEQLRNLGVESQIQRTTVSVAPHTAATVENVIGVIKGTASTRAVALAAHYDSVPYGPGASDDGMGVAAMLEAARTIKAGPPLKNDLLLVFTDGEEGFKRGEGLRGAVAFAEQHPLAKNVGVMLNFDCRGTTGCVYMYETSPNNGWLIREMARAGCRPVASSFMGDLSRKMPTGSDFEAFLDVGMEGLNFAHVKGVTRYHTMLDDTRHLDKRTLQHHGEYGFKLARHFGNLPLDQVSAPDAVFFNPLGSLMMVYPVTWVWPLNIVALLAALAACITAVRRKATTPRQIVTSILVWLLSVLAVTAFCVAFVAVGFLLRGPYVVYGGGWNALALTVLMFGVSCAVLAKPGLTASGSAAALCVWAVCTVIVSLVSPGASFLFTWPLLGGALGLAVIVLAPDGRVGIGTTFALIVSALPGVCLWTASAWGAYPALTVVFWPGVVLALMFFMGLLTPHLACAFSQMRGRLLAGTCILAVLLFVIGALNAGFTREHPKFNSVNYGLDADTGKAYWLSNDDKADEWTSQFFATNTKPHKVPEFVPQEDEGAFLKADAPVLPIEPPAVTLLDDRSEQDVRTVRLKVDSPRHAQRVVFYPEGMTVVGAKVNGVSLEPLPKPWRLSYSIFPAEGIELELQVKGTPDSGTGKVPVGLRLVEYSYSMPEFPDKPIAPRPAHLMVKPNTLDFNYGDLKSDMTLVTKTFMF